MSDRLKKYLGHILQEVHVNCADDISVRAREESFSEYVLALLSEHNEADCATVCFYEARNVGRAVPAAKLSAWSLSGDGATLDLFVTMYHGVEDVAEIGKPEVRRQFQLLRGFLHRALEGLHEQTNESNDVFNVLQRIHEVRDSLTTVRLFFLTDGIVSSTEIQEESIKGLEVKYVFWDLDKLSRLRVGDRQVIELDFVNDYGGSVPCLHTADVTGEYRTFLAFFPALLLARIYGEHGQRLLERNVRAFLQAKGKVNRGLQRTLKDEPHRFLAYNNGLCCTASEVRVNSEPNGQARLEWVKDFQIVNGGQTTASIYHALKKEKTNIDNVAVQIKLTVLKDSSRVAEIVPLISRFANSQNKVNAADFSANGPFHHQLEQLSRTVWAPATTGLERGTHWYYERARGSYPDDKMRQGAPAKQRLWENENPPHQKFSKTDLAKFENAWVGLPHFVCLGAEKNFIRLAERMEEDGEPVVDGNYFRCLIAKALLFRTAEKLFSLQELEGYRANSVAYAISWLVEKSGKRIDLERIWREQRTSSALCNALKYVLAASHEHITRQAGNPGEISKRESCWHEFREKELDVPGDWRSELAEKIFVAPNTQEEALAAEWERIRNEFISDSRTIEELEAVTGKVWMRTRRGDPAYFYAEKSWAQLRNEKLQGSKRMGILNLRGLIELMSAAAQK
jgi:hypothetical protein